MIIFFDMKRTTTRISTSGMVHILEDGNSERALCGRKVYEENHRDRQPTCATCIGKAILRPTDFFYTKRITPL